MIHEYNEPMCKFYFQSLDSFPSFGFARFFTFFLNNPMCECFFCELFVTQSSYECQTITSVKRIILICFSFKVKESISTHRNPIGIFSLFSLSWRNTEINGNQWMQVLKRYWNEQTCFSRYQYKLNRAVLFGNFRDKQIRFISMFNFCCFISPY